MKKTTSGAKILKAIRIPQFEPIKDCFRFDVPMAPITWMKCGGNALVIFRPKNEDELILFLKHFEFKKNIVVLGACSNVIIRDGGICGVVIRLGKSFASINCTGYKITVGAAALDSSLANFCMQNEISGLEFFSTIPGTIGGAIASNAGCYNNETKNVIQTISAVDMDGNKLQFGKEEIGFSYRHCSLAGKVIFTSAVFVGHQATAKEIYATIKQMQQQRNSTQPLKEKTTGSTFTNPHNIKAWQLIDKCGLRGVCIDGAKFSETHCNFLINTGNASAIALENLGEMAKKMIKKEFGISLKWEVIRIGQKINNAK